MDRIETALARFAEGFSCSQSVFSAYAEMFGVERSEALRVAAGFGGGMGRMAETCGAVTGAIMVLGLKFGNDRPGGEAKEAAYAPVRQFAERFQQRRGTLSCRELLSCNISRAEGLQRARESGAFSTICPQVVRDACEILEEMLTAEA